MTITRNIAVRDLGKYERQLAKQLPDVAKRVNRDTAKKAIGILQKTARAVRPYPPIDTKRYINSFEIQRAPQDTVVVTNRRGYAGVIEDGRRAGARQPPVSALKGWVRRKFGVSPQRALGIAFAVARNIGKRGIKAKKVVTSAMPEIGRTFTKALFDANQKWLGGKP